MCDYCTAGRTLLSMLFVGRAYLSIFGGRTMGDDDDDLDMVFTVSLEEKENLCLYGFPNESWEVNLPAEEVPPDLPEPALGINFARDGMQEKEWLSMVAAHSDAWLLSVAFYFGARFGFNKNDRKRLYSLIDDLPMAFEIVSGKSETKAPAPPSSSNHSNIKPKSNNKKKPPEPKVKQPKPRAPAEEGEEEDGSASEGEHGETLCGACKESYGPDEFWICCDLCEKWFHGKCVKITAAKAEHIKQYKCPSCTGGGGVSNSGTKRARPS
ncbi:putative RING zinc finger and PHD zinc finger domain family protein isoform X1 [Zea mays]|uniref:putative RING zinc finger and PHD zinc finger domain family protein isoform X1 n=1 Tax=Zea mays TaxID=4577 RepID=UPI0004DEBE9F|nr:putative RING zinc finger and PHD zinc finger domain family protein isoform X1 [Zea mays]|eukprot:XP_023156315.1 putative RING zinc finger and PHD zinc finger domain family protein isoform X1 [Zea mays]